MTNNECAEELNRITRKIDDLASDLTDDKYSLAIDKIKKELETCKEKLDFVIKNLE